MWLYKKEAYNSRLTKNIDTDNKFKKSFDTMKFFRNDMNMAIACNALVELNTTDDIGVYIRAEDFSPADLNVTVPVTV